jgi:hypothetical protein
VAMTEIKNVTLENGTVIQVLLELKSPTFDQFLTMILES